jgi:hypothetical protein
MSATQTKHPWRATIRTLIQAGIAAAAAAPLVYTAITQADPGTSAGAAAAFLAVAGGITRVAALPAVDQFIRRFMPCLAPDPFGPDPQQLPDSTTQQGRTAPAADHYNSPDRN